MSNTLFDKIIAEFDSFMDSANGVYGSHPGATGAISTIGGLLEDASGNPLIKPRLDAVGGAAAYLDVVLQAVYVGIAGYRGDNREVANRALGAALGTVLGPLYAAELLFGRPGELQALSGTFQENVMRLLVDEPGRQQAILDDVIDRYYSGKERAPNTALQISRDTQSTVILERQSFSSIVLDANLSGTSIEASRDGNDIIFALGSGAQVRVESWFAGKACGLRLPNGNFLAAATLDSQLQLPSRVVYSTPVYDSSQFGAVLGSYGGAFTSALSFYGQQLQVANYADYIFSQGVASTLVTGLSQQGSPIYSWGWRAGLFTEAAGVTSIEGVFDWVEDGRLRSATQATTISTAADAVLRADLRYDFWLNNTGTYSFAVTNAFTANGGQTILSDGSVVPLTNHHQLDYSERQLTTTGSSEPYVLFDSSSIGFKPVGADGAVSVSTHLGENGETIQTVEYCDGSKTVKTLVEGIVKAAVNYTPSGAVFSSVDNDTNSLLARGSTYHWAFNGTSGHYSSQSGGFYLTQQPGPSGLSDVIITVPGWDPQVVRYGGEGDDELWGGATPGNDVLDGRAGDDRLYGRGGDDILIGGPGVDLLDGGDGNDQLYGSEHNDQLWGQAGDDRLFGGDGDDRIYGNDGNDWAEGGQGNDLLAGGNGNDVLHGEEGDDDLFGGAGNDRLYGGSGVNRLYGEAGDDTLVGGQDRNILSGGAGNDTLYAHGLYDELYGGGDFDTYHLNAHDGAQRLLFEDAGGGVVDLSQYYEKGISLSVHKTSADQLILSMSNSERLVINGWAHQATVLQAGSQTLSWADLTSRPNVFQLFGP